MKTLFLLLFPIYSFTQNISDVDWLLGKWQQIDIDKGKITTETWAFENDNYIGHSFTLTKGKKTFEENMKLKFIDGVLTYSVNAPENNGWVNFTLSKPAQKDILVFENKLHDFPKYIKYQLKDSKTIAAEVGDDENKVPFVFTKVAENDSLALTIIFSKMQLAYHVGDFSKLATYYCKDGMIIGGNNVIEGNDNIEKYWNTFSKGNWKLNTNWIKISDDHSVHRGSSVITYKDKPNDSVEFLLNWKKQNGRWQIYQDIYW